LHQLGRQLQVNLHPEEVYSKLDAPLVTTFGFSIGLLGLCSDPPTIEWRSLIGTSPQVAQQLKAHLIEAGLVKAILSNPAPRLLDASFTTDAAGRHLLELLGVPIALLAGVVPHTGPRGCLILGRTQRALTNPKADEELIAILTNYLATLAAWSFGSEDLPVRLMDADESD
jgi:hypothetical protein